MELPSEIVQQIQSYLTLQNYIPTRSTAKSFSYPSSHLFPFNRTDIKLPRHITRVTLGPDVQDWQIFDAIQLEELNLFQNQKITDQGIINLVNLKELSLNRNITDIGLEGKRLEELAMEDNKLVSEEMIASMTSLWNINMQQSQMSDKAIENLPLTTLYLHNNMTITDWGIRKLNLSGLALDANQNITDQGIRSKINLVELYLGMNQNITDDGIKNMMKLEVLGIDHNRNISREMITHLVKNGRLRLIQYPRHERRVKIVNGLLKFH